MSAKSGPAPVDLGRRLRELRQAAGLSLRELSRRSGIAVSFLSALERGKTNVTVVNLKAILDVFGQTLGDFFGGSAAPPAKIVYRREELVEISGQAKGLSFREVAAGRPGRLLQLLVKRYEPGATTGEKPYRHGAQEAGVVLRGTLELILEGEVYRLRAGDAFYFDSSRPHRFRNPGRVPVDLVSVNTPPSL